MSDGTMSFLWGAGQKSKKQRFAAAMSEDNIEGVASPMQQKLDELVDEVQHLKVVTEALWELLAERATISQDELEDRIEEVGSRDSHANPLVDCPCGARYAMDIPSCDFCGRPRPTTATEF